MKARLLCKFGELKGSEFEIGAEATIGRAEQNTVVLPSSSISSDHARIYWDGEGQSYVLEDLGSLNGTQVDGIPVGERQRLGDLHVVTFGKTVELMFVLGDARVSSGPQAESTDPATLTPPKQAAGSEPPSEATTQVDVEPLSLPELLENPAAGIQPEDVEEIDLHRTVVQTETPDVPESLGSHPDDGPGDRDERE